MFLGFGLIVLLLGVALDDLACIVVGSLMAIGASLYDIARGGGAGPGGMPRV